MDYQASLDRVRSLSSAKPGTSHWWLQRVTAVVLIPLSYWLIVLLDLSFNASYQDTVIWLSSPVNAVSIILWVVSVFYHSALGLQVVIEDYVSEDRLKKTAIWSVNLIFLVLALAALIAVFRIIFTG